MADVMMGDDDNDRNPIFHDFLGTTTFSGGSTGVGGGKGKVVSTEQETSASLASMGDASSGDFGLVTGSSDLGTGRKRCNSDSAFMGMTRDQTHYSKVFKNDVHSERYRRMFNPQDMQQQQQQQQQHQKPSPGSLIQTRPSNPILSKWEQLPLSMNAATPSSLICHHQNQHLSQGGVIAAADNIQVGSKASVASTVITQAAADEGSRTGIQGAATDILNTIDRNTRQRVLEFSDMPRVTCTRQMTIFYDGQAHVFDDVHQSKADVIMALAGSNGGSWTTTYGKSRAKATEAGEAEASRRNLVFSQNLNSVSIQQPSTRAPAPITGDILNFITGVQKGGGSRDTILLEANNDGKRKL